MRLLPGSTAPRQPSSSGPRVSRTVLRLALLALCVIPLGSEALFGSSPDAAAQEAAAREHEISGAGIFTHLYEHVVPHELEGWGIDLGFVQIPLFNIVVFQVLAVVLMLLLFLHVHRGLVWTASGGKTGWIARVFSGFVLFIRDDMVLPILGAADGKKLLPYFLCQFFFIAFMNLFGLIPGGATATACIFVTAALAMCTLVMMIALGMKEQGALGFWKNLVPHGLPVLLVPLLFVVEVIGLVVKAIALTIRLFANMLAGHLVVLSLMGLIFYFKESIGGLAYAVALPAVALAVFIMIIEGFVALLQAYIFTYLSILFVGMCLHPEH
ncbi:MAG: F0F1 ATP synthase subunit A [Planctomycetota bacterium]